MDEVLSDPHTERAVKSKLQFVCSLVPDSIQHACFTYTEKYFDIVFVFMQQFLKPNHVCGALNLCRRSVDIDDDFMEMINIFSQNTIIEFEKDKINDFIDEFINSVKVELDDENQDDSKRPLEMITSRSTCRICSGLITIVKKTLGHQNSVVRLL